MTQNWHPDGSKPGDNARESRVSKLLSLEVSNSHGQRFKIVVRNLSPHGIGARSDMPALECERLTVHLPDGTDIGATVRWVRKGTLGLSLDERIEPERFKVSQLASGAGLTTRDSFNEFERLRHKGSTVRAGFQRNHRDEVLNTSHWAAPNRHGRV